MAIKRQWEKGTLKHRLVNYVMNYDKSYFLVYADLVRGEMVKRNIKYQLKCFCEIIEFCGNDIGTNTYPEHNDRYFLQCYYNLQEKFDRGIILYDEWSEIENHFQIETLEKEFYISNYALPFDKQVKEDLEKIKLERSESNAKIS